MVNHYIIYLGGVGETTGVSTKSFHESLVRMGCTYEAYATQVPVDQRVGASKCGLLDIDEGELVVVKAPDVLTKDRLVDIVNSTPLAQLSAVDIRIKEAKPLK
ncbi:hypothetical protein J4444_00010 [Candidatus Woesearchaeota archaeon]|nr:hypothetical protein [Candidatus Woesearchaeota archaeon]